MSNEMNMTIDEMVLEKEKNTSPFEEMGTAVDVMEFESPIMANPIKLHNTLPAGDYPFTITGVEKRYYEPKPGGKLPACWMVEVKMELDGGDLGLGEVINRLYWYKTTQWKISQLWISVGLAKEGCEFVPNINQLIGRKGLCKVDRVQYTRKDGTTAFYNELKRCYQPRR